MRTAVQDIHHRNRQAASGNTSQEPIQRNSCRTCRRPRRRDGHRKHGIGSQTGFIGRSIQLYHRMIHGIEISGIQSAHRLTDFFIDMRYRMQDTLSAVAAGISVAQFQRFKHTGRCAARRSTASDRSIRQHDFRLHRRISAGVENLAADYFFNPYMIHDTSSLSEKDSLACPKTTEINHSLLTPYYI